MPPSETGPDGTGEDEQDAGVETAPVKTTAKPTRKSRAAAK